MISWAMAWCAVKSGRYIDEAFFIFTGFFDATIILGIIYLLKH